VNRTWPVIFGRRLLSHKFRHSGAAGRALFIAVCSVECMSSYSFGKLHASEECVTGILAC
jgi:hypothetical protein